MGSTLDFRFVKCAGTYEKHCWPVPVKRLSLKFGGML
jgi:hypothetical protein